MAWSRSKPALVEVTPPAATSASPAPGKEPIEAEPLIGLRWAWRLRWAALGGQLAALGLARLALGIQPEWTKLAPLVLALGASNLALARWLNQGLGSRGAIHAVLLFDVAQLTGFLWWSGGAANPFSALFIVHVAIAALMLGWAWALLLLALTSSCFGALFLAPAHELGVHALHAASSLHLRGMWAAYVLAAAFVAYFVSRVAAALRERERQMAALRRRIGGMERVASLSSMAAGAAHELGTPLSSIAVSAHELSTALAADAEWAGFAEEARHIREEVARCRRILDRLAMGAGHPAGEAPRWLSADEIVALVREELGAAEASTLAVDQSALGGRRVHGPPRALGHALKNLVKNGIDAVRSSADDGLVVLRLAALEGRAMFEVIDSGPGMPDSVLERLGEPFFTTKPVGAGMGLGIYLARSFVEQVGGRLQVDSRPGAGTRVTITLGEGSLAPESAP